MSRTENSLRNIRFSLFFNVAGLIVSFFSRKVFVMTLTKEYLGLNGTFSNILSMLSLAELGIGGAITYSLYKPLAERDTRQISALMGLYRRAYRTIGLVVALLGAALTPFLPILIRDMPDIPHINLIYLLFVLNTSLSYLLSYKRSLIVADQRQYIVIACQSLLDILLHLAQALLLWLTKNYFVFLGLQIGTTMLGNLILSKTADKFYPCIKTGRPDTLEPQIKNEIVRNTKAMIAHKIGTVVVFGTDNMLIAYFIGVVEVGLYSNYMIITGALHSLYAQLFSALTASIGNLGATASQKHTLTVFQRLNFAGNWLYGFSTVCLTVLLNPFINLWVGPDYRFSQSIVNLIALNFYVTGMRQAVLTFRDAEGLYWYDRYKALAESAINLAVSAVLAMRMGIVGILIGTFISTMTTCFWVEPLVLFKHGLHSSVKPFFQDYAVNTAITLLTIVSVWHICAILPGTGLLLFIEKMAACAVGGNLGYLLVYHKREEFHYFTELLKKMLPISR